MKLQAKVLRITLIVMTIFISISAFSGGISLLFGIIDLPLKQLEGSIFKDYTIPGLALSLIVGDSMLLATILLIRKSRYARIVLPTTLHACGLELVEQQINGHLALRLLAICPVLRTLSAAIIITRFRYSE